MGLGHLMDAAARERRRRLLGEDMVAAVRRPSRAQVDAHLAATATGEEPRVLETLMTGLLSLRSTTSEVIGPQQVKQQSGQILCPGPGQDDARHFLPQVEPEGPLCLWSNSAVSESHRPEDAKLTGAALVVVDGGCQTNHHAVTANREETSAVLRSSSAVARAGKMMVEHRSHGMRDPADARYFLLPVEQTHRRTATAPCEQVGWLETPIPGQHTATVFQSSTAAGKFSKVDDSQDSDSDGNDNRMMPIFIRNGSGVLTLTVRINESTNGMMELYAQRSMTSLESQYFVYDRKRLEPHHTWLSCGLKRDTTVHVCTRLLGGADHPNLQEYINNNRLMFVKEVSLPDGRASLQMTPIGCRFLSSWIRCFTTQFIQGRSWNGEFDLVDFKFVQGHVRPKKRAKVHHETSAMGADIIKFADEVKSILNFSHIENVVSSHPPYVQSCMKVLCDLVGPIPGPLTAVTGNMSNKYKVLLDSLVCCMTSNARESLIIQLYRKYEGADMKETSDWENAIKNSNCKGTWLSDLSNTTIFGYFISKNNYPSGKTGAFTLLRDVVINASDRSGNPDAPKLGDGIELMIPATLEDFLPSIIKNLIEENIDISTELSAAISCACEICDAQQVV